MNTDFKSVNSSGRVQVLQGDNYDMYKLFDDNKKNSYNQEAIKGVHVDNQLANIYFSSSNIDYLQESIRYLVYKKTCGKYTISKQSETELKLIMRAFYLQEGKHNIYGALEEVKSLNTFVLNYAVPKIIQEINMYMQYKQDIDTVPMPLDRGQLATSKGSKQLINKEF